eukprot:1195770-Prorocentrum_minimum.AAC.2
MWEPGMDGLGHPQTEPHPIAVDADISPAQPAGGVERVLLALRQVVLAQHPEEARQHGRPHRAKLRRELGLPLAGRADYWCHTRQHVDRDRPLAPVGGVPEQAADPLYRHEDTTCRSRTNTVCFCAPR